MIIEVVCAPPLGHHARHRRRQRQGLVRVSVHVLFVLVLAANELAIGLEVGLSPKPELDIVVAVGLEGAEADACSETKHDSSPEMEQKWTESACDVVGDEVVLLSEAVLREPLVELDVAVCLEV